jgi:hypothetical protein
MSNVNTVADVIIGQNAGQPITLAASTTLHKAFSIGGSAAVLSLPNPLALIDSATTFPGRAAQAIPFLIRAAGTGGGGGELYEITINQGTGLTPVIAKTGLFSGVADNWLLEAECMWDSASLFLRGFFYGWAGAVLVGQAALSSVISPANLGALQFTCAVQIQQANANASFSLTEFSAELL